MELLFYKTDLPIVIEMVSPWIANTFQSAYPLYSFTVQYNKENNIFVVSDNATTFKLLKNDYEINLYELDFIDMLNQDYGIQINAYDDSLMKVIDSENYKEELEDFELAMYMLYDEISTF